MMMMSCPADYDVGMIADACIWASLSGTQLNCRLGRLGLDLNSKLLRSEPPCMAFNENRDNQWLITV